MPLDALFNIRAGVASSRNDIDVDRFIDRWNRELNGKVELKTVEFVPDKEETAGPLSWHLTKRDIQHLEESWGVGDQPAGWKRGIRRNWCAMAPFLGQEVGHECAEFQNNP